MKKLLVAVFAITGLVACNTEETLRMENGAPISFDTFVEKATRATNDPSTTTNSIEEFYVWSYMNEPDGVVFDNERVWKANSAWTYTQTQYWLPGNTYHFAAVSGNNIGQEIVLAENVQMNEAGLGTATFVNVDGTNDFLYTTVERETPSTITSAQDAVNLQFQHLLSKVKFTFHNGFVNHNTTLVVENIKMVATKSATVDLGRTGEYEWTNHADATTLDFGHINGGKKVEISKQGTSDNERLTIPVGAEYEYIVTFDVTPYNGEQPANTVRKEVKITGCELAPGRAYNFSAILNQNNISENPLYPVEFIVSVDEWITSDTEVGSDTYEAELRYAAQIGGDFTLKKDINLSEPLIVSTTFVLNLNGFTITGGKEYVKDQVSGTDITAISIANGGDLTINGNGKIIGTSYGMNLVDGTLTINGGYIEGEVTSIQLGNREQKKAFLNITGGQFVSEGENSRYVINFINDAYFDNSAKVNITGGSYYKFNPAASRSEGNFEANFCAPGYTTIEENDWYTVVPGLGVATAQEFRDACAKDSDADKICVTNSIDFFSYSGTPRLDIYNEDVTINMQNMVMRAGTPTTYDVRAAILCHRFSNTTIENANIIATQGGIYLNDAAQLTFNSGKIYMDPETTELRYLFYLAKPREHGPTVLTINGGKFSFNAESNLNRGYIYTNAGSTVYITGGEFGPATSARPAGIYGSGTVIITGGTFGFNPSKWVAEGYEAVQNNSTWTVKKK